MYKTHTFWEGTMINIAFFSAKSYDEASFNKIKNNRDFEFHYHDFRL
ncbi:2-hydroxyacid dehydrogenase, partial [Vibrio sp. 1974]|nr:2-hydroxyacid dehydrogenase [Vibrio sp. 1974]